MKDGPVVPFLVIACIAIGGMSCNSGLMTGKRNARFWHCHSQGYQDYTVTERGTIQCIKISRETIQ